MFKEILQFSLVVALVVAKNSSEESGEEMEKSEGLCMDPEEVVYWCTAGTPLGEKLMGASRPAPVLRRRRPLAGRREAERSARRERNARGKEREKEKERGKVRSVPVLTRSRPGSWRNTKTSCVCSLSWAGWTTLVTGARPLPRLTWPLSHPM